MRIVDLILFIGIFGLIDYYLFAPYWILILIGVPFLLFLMLTLMIDFFRNSKSGSEASGFGVAAAMMLATSWILLKAALVAVIPYYVVKFVWLALS
jgi:hypothetical protein